MNKHLVTAWILCTGILLSSFAHGTTPSRDNNPLIFLPFGHLQDVHCVQGNDGSYSHQGTQYYAYDFDMGSSENSSANPIYNMPIYSPVSGTIVELRQGVPDFSNNSSSNASNNYGWGNTIVIQPYNSSYYIRIAHMKYNSTPSTLQVGDWVEQGDLIGRVGQTGYSSHPHLHIQMQSTIRGESVPFDFVEGPIDTGDWVASELERNLYVVDSDRRNNQGAPIGDPNLWWNASSVSLYNSVVESGSTGDDYRGSSSTGAMFYWGFDIEQEGRYDVYASCRGLSNRDPGARYRIYRYGIDRRTTVDQRYLGKEKRAYLGTVNFVSGNRYYVSVERSSGRLCADAIFLRYNGE